MKCVIVGQAPEGGVECINSGWGVTDDGRTADKLQVKEIGYKDMSSSLSVIVSMYHCL